MFGLSKSSPSIEQPGEVAAATKAHSQTDLIDQLIVHQSQIYADYQELVYASKQDVHKDIEVALIHFKSEIQSYLLEKNVKLYTYFQNSVELSSSQTMTVNNSRAINSQLSRVTNQFIDRYFNNGDVILEQSQYTEFKKELNAVGTQIVQSMRDERDNLFPIYDAHTSS